MSFTRKSFLLGVLLLLFACLVTACKTEVEDESAVEIIQDLDIVPYGSSLKPHFLPIKFHDILYLPLDLINQISRDEFVYDADEKTLTVGRTYSYQDLSGYREYYEDVFGTIKENLENMKASGSAEGLYEFYLVADDQHRRVMKELRAVNYEFLDRSDQLLAEGYLAAFKVGLVVEDLMRYYGHILDAVNAKDKDRLDGLADQFEFRSRDLRYHAEYFLSRLDSLAKLPENGGKSPENNTGAVEETSILLIPVNPLDIKDILRTEIGS